MAEKPAPPPSQALLVLLSPTQAFLWAATFLLWGYAFALQTLASGSVLGAAGFGLPVEFPPTHNSTQPPMNLEGFAGNAASPMATMRPSPIHNSTEAPNTPIGFGGNATSPMVTMQPASVVSRTGKMCSARGSFAWEDSSKVLPPWLPHAIDDSADVDAHVHLVFEGCETGELLTQAAVAQCLSGRHILMIGDSIMRYAYYQLVLFLVTGDWAPYPRNPCDFHHFWPTFNEYFAECANRTKGAEVCDCFRVGSLPEAEAHYFFDGALRITFVFTEGTRWTHARHDLNWLNVTCGARGAHCMQAGCGPAECTELSGPLEPLDESQPHLAALAGAIARHLPVDVALFNSGLHTPLWDMLPVVAATADALRTAAVDAGVPPPALLWKSTTACTGVFVDFDHARERLEVETHLVPDGWRVFDAHELTAHPTLEAAAGGRQFFYGIHLRPSVNRGLNEALLLDLCFTNAAPLREGGTTTRQ